MEENKIEQDVFITHGYAKNQEILINAEFLLGVLAFCRRVQDSQPKVAALLQYPSDIKLVKEILNITDSLWATTNIQVNYVQTT